MEAKSAKPWGIIMVQTYGLDAKSVRRHRRLRNTVVAAAACAAVIAILFMTGIIRIYGGENAGIVVGWPCHNVGYEWRGNPGFFTDAC